MFIFNDTATAEFYTYRHPLPLHGALPISPAAAYLAVSGVGPLVLADDDEVELSNLQRQILHTTARVGWPKAESGKHMLAALNRSEEHTSELQSLICMSYAVVCLNKHKSRMTTSSTAIYFRQHNIIE